MSLVFRASKTMQEVGSRKLKREKPGWGPILRPGWEGGSLFERDDLLTPNPHASIDNSTR